MTARLEWLRELRARLVFAREALTDGELMTAAAVLRDLEDFVGEAQADEITRAKRRARRARVTCENCGARFTWPGELDAHRLRFHGDVGDAA